MFQPVDDRAVDFYAIFQSNIAWKEYAGEDFTFQTRQCHSLPSWSLALPPGIGPLQQTAILSEKMPHSNFIGPQQKTINAKCISQFLPLPPSTSPSSLTHPRYIQTPPSPPTNNNSPPLRLPPNKHRSHPALLRIQHFPLPYTNTLSNTDPEFQT